MPKQTPSIPNEVLWAQLGDRSLLSDELWLIAAQVGMLLGRSTDQLAEDRKVGNPPPFKKDGGSIRYRLGTVRDHMFGSPEHNNTTQARLSVERNKFGSFSNLIEWEAHAKPADLWPFLIRRSERPIDFWKSLTLGADLSDDDQCVLINFDEYRSLCRDSSQSRELEPKTVQARDQSGSMREKFVCFLDDVAALGLKVICPARIAQAPFDAITDSVHLWWIQEILNSATDQSHSLGFSMIVTLREAYAAKVDAWTIPTGIEILLNVGRKTDRQAVQDESPEIRYFVRQASEAALFGDLPMTCSDYGEVVVKPIDFLRWALANRLPVDPDVARAIDSRILGSISVKGKPGRPRDTELEKRGKEWRADAFKMMKAEPKINLSAAARKISKAKNVPMETIRKQLTKALMVADGFEY